MIQRIQTLYLLAVVALGIALFWLPVLQFVSPDGQVYQLTALGGAPLQGLWGLTVTTVLIPLLALVDIFLYRKRLGYYGVLAIYIWLAKMSLQAEWYILPWASFPLIGMVLTLMATRRILKDEALVRAADRIR